MKSFLSIIGIVIVYCPLFAQDFSKPNKFEISSGTSMMLYQSVFSFQESIAFETAFRGNLTGNWDWQVGARLGFDPALPDGFIRLLAAPRIGAWQPFVGFEFGVTNRAHFKQGENLLQETRAAMEGDISHFYVAGHSAPLSFKVWDKWRVSVLELHIGTNLGHTGQTVRVQVGVISIGRTI